MPIPQTIPRITAAGQTTRWRARRARNMEQLPTARMLLSRTAKPRRPRRRRLLRHRHLAHLRHGRIRGRIATVAHSAMANGAKPHRAPERRRQHRRLKPANEFNRMEARAPARLRNPSPSRATRGPRSGLETRPSARTENGVGVRASGCGISASARTQGRGGCRRANAQSQSATGTPEA
jgi:hypothetical protein